MKKRTVRLPRSNEGGMLLDIASYGRRGPGHRPLSKAEVDHISRTIRRVPEVMVKVSGGARTLRGVEDHLDYIGREGEGEVETDDGRRLREEGLGRELVNDWDLDLEARRWHTLRAIAAGRKPPKLVHNLVFSMPKGIPADKVLQAVRVFAREKFALQHRYVLALHTDQGHPHVHVVVKAVSEQGVRLNIRKATLRAWRRDFAQYLRDLGVEANATERAVRGSPHQNRKTGIYRADARGESSFVREREAAVARELRIADPRPEPGRSRLLQTRRDVERGWLAFADAAARYGMREAADQVRRFVAQLPSVRTDREWLAEKIRAAARERALPTR